MNVGISVSRVGGNAQIKAMKKVAGPLKIELAMYRELEAFAKFGSELDPTTQQQLRRGARLVEILKQPQYSPMPVEEQIVVLYAATKGWLDPLPLELVSTFERELLEYMRTFHRQDILEAILDTQDLTPEITERLDAALKSFSEEFRRAHGLHA
jgi:F-type H+-transporting ATPase subunit alpha